MNSPGLKAPGILAPTVLGPGPMRKGLHWVILGLAVCCLQGGCAANHDRNQDRADGPMEPSPPEWVLTGKAPKLGEGIVCAVGVAGPTYFRTDAVEAATEDARAELARTLQVRIQSQSLDVQTDGTGSRRSQTVMQISSYVNELVLKGSKVVQIWYDRSGKGFAKKRRCTYALVCLDGARTMPTTAPSKP